MKIKAGSVAVHDGWANLLTGMGTTKDRTRYTEFSNDIWLTQQSLDAIYRGDGIGRRVVDVVAEELTRQWIEIDGDPDGGIVKYLRKIGARKYMTLALKWARLYGGSVIVIGADDGGSLDKPINEDRIKDIVFMRVYGRFQVMPGVNMLINDPWDKDFGMPELYRINPIGGTPYDVHRSRLLIFDGEDVSDEIRAHNQGWGDSSLQSVYDSIRSLGTGFNSATQILTEFVQATLSVKGLQDLLMSDEGTSAVKKRLEIMDLSRSVLNLLLLDENEIFDKKASSVAGLADLLDRFQVYCSATTGIPVTKLFGRSPAGENATGESDLRNWYDDLKATQEDELRPLVERMVFLVCLAKAGPTKGSFNEDYEVAFKPLWQLSALQEADLREQVSKADERYVRVGILLPEEVAKSRWGGEKYSMEVELDETLRAKREKEKEEMKDKLLSAGPAPGKPGEGAPGTPALEKKGEEEEGK